MVWKVGMPNLGHTMETGTVFEWTRSVGDRVSTGDAIGLVETDKATFDIEAPADGVLLKIYVEAGIEVPVGDTIAAIGAPGEPLPDESPAPAAPNAPVAPAPPAPSGPLSGRIKASPAARRLADELGVDLSTLAGTGDDGMITRDDVTEAAAAAPEGVLLTSMRRAIAETTTRAWSSIPHVALTSHAELPEDLGTGAGQVTAAAVRATALALQAHPGLNGWLTQDRFQQASGSDIGVVVAVPGGLVSVTLFGAEAKDTGEIAQELADLAKQARAGTLRGARTEGASFTVSSLGRWGIDTFAPVIAAPQVAILGIGRVQRVAREAADGSLRFVSQLGLTLVFDHRANDGVAAAECLATIVAHLEGRT